MQTNHIYTTAEKQLISSLAWFRTRYALFIGFSLEQKADRQHIELFAKIWLGGFKTDWTTAFDSLCQKGILTQNGDEYSFTEYGQTVKERLDLETPFYKYEYDNYFLLEKQSPAHSEFCKRVYGLDLSQHGLIDQSELAWLIELLQKNKPQTIADIGCGNGRISEWISTTTKTACLGLDISSEAVKNAQMRTANNPLLSFKLGNLNDLQLKENVDAILFLDTLYYSQNLKNTIQRAVELLNQGGYIYAYFSQWIMDAAYSENLQADKTNLAKVLNELGLNYDYIDLSKSGVEHWGKKLAVLNDMKTDFEAEGSRELWVYREREASRYANWSGDKYARYLYTIRKV